jgi:elongation factor Ts
MGVVTAQMVKDLRDKTGAGMMDCKNALAESDGDIEKAIDFLRKKGLKSVSKRADKVAAEGAVLSYIHGNGRIGVMVEVNCETDFVSRGDDFQGLVKTIAMHIAWASPKWVRREEVPADVLNREQEVFKSQLTPQQANMADKIIPGKLEKFYQEVCLLEQQDVRDPSVKRSINDLVNEVSAKVGEKVIVRRFERYELGEGIEKQESNYLEEVKAAMQ